MLAPGVGGVMGMVPLGVGNIGISLVVGGDIGIWLMGGEITMPPEPPVAVPLVV